MSFFPTAKQIFDNADVAAAILFCLSAGIGQVTHGVKKWADGEVDCILSWYTKNIRRTVGAAIGNGAGMLIFIQTGVLGPVMSMPNGWWAICLFGFMNGFSSDSALNKATRTAWTPEQRDSAKP